MGSYKKVTVEAANVGRLKPSDVVRKVSAALNDNPITLNLHVTLYKLFKIRPPNGAEDQFDTNTEFCLYDETHNDYVYQEKWVVFIINFMENSGFNPSELRRKLINEEHLNLQEYQI